MPCCVKYGRKELPIEVIGTYIGDGAPMLIRRALGDPADREFLQEALNYFLHLLPRAQTRQHQAYDGHTARRWSRSANLMACRANWRCSPTSRSEYRATFWQDSDWPATFFRSMAATVSRPRNLIRWEPTL